MSLIKRFIKSNAVLVIALIAAAVTMIIVPPDAQYAGYFDLKTLFNLFIMMLVIAALKNMRFFVWLASIIISRLKNARRIVFALVFITFFASMFLANDMALLTFLPLTLTVFRVSEKPRYCAFTIIMQNIAANLGGMLLPFGNPQSLYLYSFFNIGTLEFIQIMWIPFAASAILITALCFIVKPESMEIAHHEDSNVKKVNLIIYAVFFVAALLSVMRVTDFYITTAVISVCMLILDRKAFLKVDYPLLLTFAAFFVFASNMARIQAVNDFVSGLVAKSALLTGVISCQFFSNVPTAIFLSKFTTDYKRLLLAVNIGGTGTPIASLASLISLGQYKKAYPGKTAKYLGLFSLINFAFLIVLTVICLFI